MNDPAKPGPKRPNAPMPLSPSELSWLYLEQKRREAARPKAKPAKKPTVSELLRAAARHK